MAVWSISLSPRARADERASERERETERDIDRTLRRTKSAAGVSVKTLHCYFFVFIGRLISITRHEGYLPYDRSGDWLYHVIARARRPPSTTPQGEKQVLLFSRRDARLSRSSLSSLSSRASRGGETPAWARDGDDD